MKSGRHRIGALAGFAVTAAAAPSALAQNQTVRAATPSPTPAPSRTPSIVTLPGVVPERFSLGPAPARTPVPAPTPSPTPPVIAAPSASAARRLPATPMPRPAAASPDRVPVLPQPTPAAATPVPQTYTPAPIASAAPSAVPMPASDEPEGSPWLWGLLGAAGTALLGVGGSLLLRRRRVAEAQGPPDPATPEPPRPVPVAPPPGLRPPAPRSADPFEIVLNPLRIALEADGAVLDLELLVRNSQAAPAEGIRIALAMMSANPEQDAAVAGFHAAPQGEPVGPPFDLPAGGGGRLPVRLTLPGERVHVVEIGGRPIFVPMVLVDLRWRAGLSIRRYGADFMVGTAGQGSKPGPIRVDRGTPAGPLAATRYVAKAAAAA